MQTRSFRLFAAAFTATLTALFIQGCATVYDLKVNATARPDAGEPVSYVLTDIGTSSQAVINAHDTREFVRTALSGKGMFEAPGAAQADLDIRFFSDVRATQGFRTTADPVYRTRSGGTYQEAVTVTDENGNTRTQYVTHRSPDIQVMVDTVERRTPIVTYEKLLRIVARENKAAVDGISPRVWDITISYDDDNPNLEKALPLLAAAACDRIGTDTHGPVVVHLRDKDEVVAFIKRGM